MSSKFSRYPTPRLRPPICYPPPGSCWPSWTKLYPTFLNAYYRWKDWHPPHPVDRHRVVRIQHVPNTPTWFGHFLHDDGYIEIQLVPVVPKVWFAVRLWCFIQPDEFLWHFWSPLEVYGPRAFDSGLLTMINDPDTDFRQCRVMGPRTIFQPDPP